jgi:ribonuclease D
MEASLRAVTIVDRPEVLADVAPILRSSTRVGVDTESNGFHSYHERVCLIQLSTPNADFIVDPIAVPDLTPIAPLFESALVQKVFHGGDYDIVCMKRDFGFRFANVFDTVVACKLLEGQEVALSKLLFRHFEIELDKTLQRSDWGRRPLSIRQLEYAVQDSRYLLALSDILRGLLRQMGHLEAAEQHFQRLCERTWTGSPFNPEGYRRVKGYFQLDPRARGVLRQLYALRDRWARRMDRPPFKVIGNLGLLNLAQQQPATAEELCRSKGFPKRPDAEMIAEVLQVLSTDAPELEPQPETLAIPAGRRRRRRRTRRPPTLD